MALAGCGGGSQPDDDEGAEWVERLCREGESALRGLSRPSFTREVVTLAPTVQATLEQGLGRLARVRDEGLRGRLREPAEAARDRLRVVARADPRRPARILEMLGSVRREGRALRRVATEAGAANCARRLEAGMDALMLPAYADHLAAVLTASRRAYRRLGEFDAENLGAGDRNFTERAQVTQRVVRDLDVPTPSSIARPHARYVRALRRYVETHRRVGRSASAGSTTPDELRSLVARALASQGSVDRANAQLARRLDAALR